MANRMAHFTTNLGSFQVELFEGRAPITTKNFIDLIEKGYYDGMVFHRVIEGFMLQAGCPKGDGTGGPGYTIPDEFHAELAHDSEGVLSMANAGPNSGGSQFFVTLAPTAMAGRQARGVRQGDRGHRDGPHDRRQGHRSRGPPARARGHRRGAHHEH